MVLNDLAPNEYSAKSFLALNCGSSKRVLAVFILENETLAESRAFSTDSVSMTSSLLDTSFSKRFLFSTLRALEEYSLRLRRHLKTKRFYKTKSNPCSP